MEIIDSSVYPLEPGSAPDRFARRPAELIGGFLAEADSPDATDSTDVSLSAVMAGGSGRTVAILLGVPEEEGYLPVDEWWVTGGAGINVGMELSLHHDASVDHAIRMLRAHGALPDEAP